MRRFLAFAIALLAGLAVGGVSALAMAGLLPGSKGLGGGGTVVGQWSADFAIGSREAGPYVRARVARHGLLALARSEAVYFTATRDQAGRPLREACRYRLAGGPMPARWWSVTLYDGASRLPMNDDRALSFDATRAGAGDWSAIIAPEEPRGANWISSRNAGTFDLTLRLYVPDPALFRDPRRVLVPPRIVRVACSGAAS